MKYRYLILLPIAAISIFFTLNIIIPKPLTTLPAGLIVNDMVLPSLSVDNTIKYLKTHRLNKKHKFYIFKWSDKQFKLSTEKVKLKVNYKLIRSELKKLSSTVDFWEKLLLKKRIRHNKYVFFTGITYNRKAVEKFLLKIKKQIQKNPVSARVDLINKKIIPGSNGRYLDIGATLAVFEHFIDKENPTIDLVIKTVKPKLSTEQLKDLSLDKVLGWYETSFIFYGKYANRAHNLKVGAAKINGYIILPGHEFSFNKTVGPRTAEQGYRMAPVIALGELIDGMGGGMCQIASTIHAAAFFAGLDLITEKPHTQPSHYIDLGLDATVVWPHVDMVIGNPYPWAIVIRINVSGGRVRVEILGKSKPYAKIGFERRIIQEKPFKVAYRDDKEMLIGTYKLDQRGEKGYLIRRRRIFFDKEGFELKSQTWSFFYPPTTMIIRKGVKPPSNPTTYQLPPVPEFRPKPNPPAFRREIQ